MLSILPASENAESELRIIKVELISGIKVPNNMINDCISPTVRRTHIKSSKSLNIRFPE